MMGPCQYRFSLPFLLVALINAGCTIPPQPYQFMVPPAPVHGGVEPRWTHGSPLDVVVSTLAANGHPPTTINRAQRIVSSVWQDTGQTAGFVLGDAATIVRRFTVTLVEVSGGYSCSVRMETRRCAVGSSSRCEVMDELVADQQDELENVGRAIEQALSR